jgi:signal peptidase I
MPVWRFPAASSVGAEMSLSNAGQRELAIAVLNAGGVFRTRVRGQSMVPFIRDSDVIVLAGLKNKPPRVGDVVAFTHPNTQALAIHRVIARDAEGWVIRGDHCTRPDGVFRQVDIIGRVIWTERNGRQTRISTRLLALCAAIASRRGLLSLAWRVYGKSRAAASVVLAAVQTFSLYRALARRLTRRVRVEIADMSDWDSVNTRLNPAGPYNRKQPDPNVTNYVAKSGAKLLGCVQLVRIPDATSPWCGEWLFSLLVFGRYRGLGAGEALTRTVLSQAKTEGADEVLLAVYPENRRATALYRKLGFVDALIPDLEPVFEDERIGTGRRRVVMRRSLGDYAEQG